jgi:hypothetical protein
MPSKRLHGPPGFARDALVARMAQDLGRDGAPRLQLLTIMLLAGGVAFLASVLLLWSPADVFEQMAVWLIMAGACAAAGVIAIGYVIYLAPILLAEVALDAAIVSVLYRRLRRDEQGYWLTTVLKRTWVPALVLVVFTFLTGFALQMAAPDARSIGGVIRSVSGSTAR